MRGRTPLLVGVIAVAIAAVGLFVYSTSGDDDPRPDQTTFCERLDRLTSNDPFAAFGDRATDAEIRQGFDALVARTRELVDLAPEDARGAARDAAEGAGDLRELLGGVDGGTGQIDPLAYRDAQTRYTAAGDRLERYLTTECS